MCIAFSVPLKYAKTLRNGQQTVKPQHFYKFKNLPGWKFLGKVREYVQGKEDTR
jgi:hypothetical protein